MRSFVATYDIYSQDKKEGLDRRERKVTQVKRDRKEPWEIQGWGMLVSLGQ